MFNILSFIISIIYVLLECVKWWLSGRENK